jgi:KDO2-lipid IV(A) lauroyltransferase
VYGISDVLSFLMFYLIPYRKKVVLYNLRNSFPEKTEKEIKQIGYQFYKHLCDLIVESVKLFNISEDEIKRRMVITNPEVADAYFVQNRPIMLVGGHYNNWEMLAVGIDSQIKHQTVGIYTKLSNAFFNDAFLKSRSKYGIEMISTREVPGYFSKGFTTPTATIFGADQSPTYTKNVFWTTFLNQETAVALGTESFAKKYNYPVVYGAINKVKRGHYSFTLEVLFDQPKDTKLGEITQAHTTQLEKQIIAEPQYWLWTHKRWKRKRQENE